MITQDRFFEARCKVCKSPHRQEYEEMRSKGRSLQDIEARAKKIQDPNPPSYASFQRHFNKHWVPHIQEKIKRDKFTETLVKEKMKQGVQILDEMMENLQICRRILTSVTDLVTKNLDDMVRSGETGILNTMRGLLSETRLTIEATQKLRGGLIVDPQEDTQESLVAIIDILQKTLSETDMIKVAKQMRESLQ
jgi:hypothetical protein